MVDNNGEEFYRYLKVKLNDSKRMSKDRAQQKRREAAEKAMREA